MIYLIRAGGTNYVKIGRSNNPIKRLADLQPYNPETLWIAALLPEHRPEIENILHKEFAKYRIRPRNEWFREANRIIEFLFEVSGIPGIHYGPGNPLFWDRSIIGVWRKLETRMAPKIKYRDKRKAFTLREAEERDAKK
jgi:T5orf172 domain